MRDILERVVVRDMVERLPGREREFAELLMAGHTQAGAARALLITGRAARYRMERLRRHLAA